MPGLKLFNNVKGDITEATPRLAEVEADVQDLVEAPMEAMLGVTFLASEYVIDWSTAEASTRWTLMRTGPR